MSLLYTLPCHNVQGDARDISFGTERQLKEDAYLELTVEPIRGVVGWKEVSFDGLPSEVQKRMGHNYWYWHRGRFPSPTPKNLIENPPARVFAILATIA